MTVAQELAKSIINVNTAPSLIDDLVKKYAIETEHSDELQFSALSELARQFVELSSRRLLLKSELDELWIDLNTARAHVCSPSALTLIAAINKLRNSKSEELDVVERQLYSLNSDITKQTEACPFISIVVSNRYIVKIDEEITLIDLGE